MNQMPYFERVKIQSEILLPLFRRLRDEIGVERASELLRESVQEYAQSLGHSISEANSGTSLEKLEAAVPMFTAANAVEVEMVAQTAEELSINVHKCKYSEYFHALGEPEFGAMVTCEIDPPMTRGIGADLNLTRTQTIMEGGHQCDFRWKLGAG